MPKLPMNYNNAVIYKIVCNDLTITDCYVGSTTNFTKRKCQHKCNCKIQPQKVYEFIRQNGDWDNWSMILVEEFSTTSKLLLEQRERYWIETLNATLNKYVPSRTGKEYYQDHKEDISEQKNQYRQDHKEERSEHQKQYYQDHKEEITERQKQFYQEHKEHILEHQKQYQQDHKKEIAEKRRIRRSNL
jgi:hypothetical protein